MRIAIAGFVVPFMAVYAPALMLQDGGPLATEIGYWPAVGYIIVKALLVDRPLGRGRDRLSVRAAHLARAHPRCCRGVLAGRGAAGDRRARLRARRSGPRLAPLAQPAAAPRLGSLSALCLSTAGALAAKLALSAFTLAWTHSVERTEWQEDWRIEHGALVVVEARVKGTGAGMEIPDDAVLRDGWYVYRPHLPPLPALDLARSGAVADWRLCAHGRCEVLGMWVGAAPSVHVFACKP